MRNRNLRCILFDLGNTLWTHTNQASWESLEHNVNQQALDLLMQYFAPPYFVSKEPVTIKSLHAVQLRKTVQTKIFELSRLDLYTEPDPAYAVQEVLRERGLPRLDRALCLDLFEALRIPTMQIRALFDDTCLTLAALRQRGFSLGVVTNRPWGGKPFLDDMQKLGLLEYFDPRHIAISADLGIRKPSTALFLQALNALNVAPEEAAMVGDSLSADILGAKALHMLTIWIPRTQHYTELPALQTDDALLASALEFENQRYRLTHTSIKPDFIIKHIRDLLTIVQESPQ